MKRSLTLLFVLLVFNITQAQTRIACIGNSITYGFGWNNPKSYPSRLDSLLGQDWEVKNFGVPGTTLLRNGDNPYNKLQAFQDVKNYNPDVVLIKLGTNDSKPQNWNVHSTEFINDYDSLLTELQQLPTSPFIILCTPVPAYSHGWGIRDSIIQLEIPILQNIANKKKLYIIDLYTPLTNHSDWFPDGIHPNEKGLNNIAMVIAPKILEWKNKIKNRKH